MVKDSTGKGLIYQALEKYQPNSTFVNLLEVTTWSFLQLFNTNLLSSFHVLGSHHAVIQHSLL